MLGGNKTRIIDYKKILDIEINENTPGNSKKSDTASDFGQIRHPIFEITN